MKTTPVIVLTFALPWTSAFLTKDGSGRLPAMGWNSYNAYGTGITRAKFVNSGQQMIDLGLKDLGYMYINGMQLPNMDEGWQSQVGRSNSTLQILPDEQRFPGGMASTAADLHQMGLKMGIYSDLGTLTCGGSPGSLFYEEIDAMTWADWEMDYVKIDNCNVPDVWTQDLYNGCHPDYDHPWGANGTCADTTRQAPPYFDWTKSSQAKRYQRMSQALAKQNRTILFSLCSWGQAHVEQWGNSTGSSWRMTDDINSNWERIVAIVAYNIFHLNYVDFWGHNDMDLLQIGNGNLSMAETRSHFALWAAMKSPLLISTTFETLTASQLAVLKNKYLIGFNQDTIFGKPAMPYKWGINPDWTYNVTNPAEYYAGQSQAGTLVLMFNPLSNTESKTASWAEIPGLEANQKYLVTDVWTGKNLGCMKDVTIDVEMHDTAALLVTNRC